MADPRPLNVQLAEALGCKPLREPWGWACPCHSHAHCRGEVHDGPGGEDRRLLSYDRDWSATGPLIEKHRISVQHNTDEDEPSWEAWKPGMEWVRYADTPLRAVCRCLLKVLKGGSGDDRMSPLWKQHLRSGGVSCACPSPVL